MLFVLFLDRDEEIQHAGFKRLVLLVSVDDQGVDQGFDAASEVTHLAKIQFDLPVPDNIALRLHLLPRRLDLLAQTHIRYLLLRLRELELQVLQGLLARIVEYLLHKLDIDFVDFR